MYIYRYIIKLLLSFYFIVILNELHSLQVLNVHRLTFELSSL